MSPTGAPRNPSLDRTRHPSRHDTTAWIRAPSPPAVIGPNAAVCQQWVEHAEKAGIPKNQTLYYNGTGARDKVWFSLIINSKILEYFVLRTACCVRVCVAPNSFRPRNPRHPRSSKSSLISSTGVIGADVTRAGS